MSNNEWVMYIIVQNKLSSKQVPTSSPRWPGMVNYGGQYSESANAIARMRSPARIAASLLGRLIVVLLSESKLLVGVECSSARSETRLSLSAVTSPEWSMDCSLDNTTGYSSCRGRRKMRRPEEIRTDAPLIWPSWPISSLLITSVNTLIMDNDHIP